MPIHDALVPATVTVVDDEPAVLDVLVRAARVWHYACQAATNAEQALRLLEESPTPIVVTDLRMPGQGGLWLVRQIRARWPDIAVIVVTAGHDTEAAIECLNAGAQRYFLKPINLDDFHHALDSTFHVYQLQRERERYRRELERRVQQQTSRMRRTFLSAIDSLVRTMEARDAYTSGHSLRVRRYALRLAEALRFGPRELKHLSLAAKLHDIGKLGIPESILNKPARLSAEEYAVIREHPVIGERILTRIIRSRSVLAAVRGHHERLDGRGYPDGLHGPHVCPLARVIAITDTFDALTSSRAYRDALPLPEALAIIRDGAGTQFDPHYVRKFLEVTPCGLSSAN